MPKSRRCDPDDGGGLSPWENSTFYAAWANLGAIFAVLYPGLLATTYLPRGEPRRAARLSRSAFGERGPRCPHRSRQHRSPARARPAGGRRLPALGRSHRREDGYLTTPTERFTTSTYALTRTRLEVDADGPDWLWNANWSGKIRIRGESAPGGQLLFIGIGPEAVVARYLGSVAHANVEEIEVDPFRVQ